MIELIKKYVIEYKDLKGFNSYSKTMASLGMERAAWTKINNGGGVSDETAVKLAEALKINPLEIIAISKAFSSKNQEVRGVWLKLAKKVKEERSK